MHTNGFYDNERRRRRVDEISICQRCAIGREFGDRHHTTVLRSINKIEAMRLADEALNRTITRLVNAVVTQT